MKPPRYTPLLIGLALLVAVAGVASIGVLAVPPSKSPALGALASTPTRVTSGAPPTELAQADLPTGEVQPTNQAMLEATFTMVPERTTQPTSPAPTLPTSPPAVPDLAPGTATPVADVQSRQEVVIGFSALGEPLVAYRLGEGPIKVVLVGDIHGAYEANTRLLVEELLRYYRSHLGGIPARVSLWFIPTLNPDGLAAGTRWNGNSVDLNRNADTDLDGCAGNDWSPDAFGSEGSHPGAGGSYPFSEPEARALRDFTADAQIVVFYHSAAGAVYADSCQRYEPSARLAQVLSQGTGYSLPEEGWTGYRITGDLADYLAGDGIAAATVELTDHDATDLERNLEGVKLLLAEVDSITGADALKAGAELVWLESSVCAWHYDDGSFVHPLALEVSGNTGYLLDAGRVLEFDLGSRGVSAFCALSEDGQAPPELRVLLQAGDAVAGVPVIEPLDLAIGATGSSSQASLLVLDRAGDVYAFDPESRAWKVERHGRSSIDTGDHYYVGVSAHGGDRFLLETTREKVWRFAQGQVGSAWADLPLGRDVDLTASEDAVYVLTRALSTPLGGLARFSGGRGSMPDGATASPSFRPGATIIRPRQVVAADSTVLVLDWAGRRLLALDSKSGALRKEYRFADRRAVSAFWADPDGSQADQTAQTDLILAGRDVLFFYPGSPSRFPEEGTARSEGDTSSLPSNPDWLESLRGLAMPIQGAKITRRDFQMPGAPRHYRLGVHQGIDFYGGTSGVTIVRGTQVRAVAAGKILRAMLDYEPLTAAQAKAWAAQVARSGSTPDDVLDGYRGRQVWIEHPNGLVSRYAHLSAIAPGIVFGAKVERGQVIGMVGNSGTPESVSNPSGEMHLHLELWAGNHYVGQFLRPIEAREWIERILR